ncbi:hypothetical protein [Rubrivirga sp. IMCC45206]|uniref:hypothetical protein n=1 Tax=Rubrivirga sp. IMCC45206 TaxID=3391614 RepID=UPI00398FC321
MRLVLLALVALLLTTSAAAQTADCEIGTAETDLDLGDVRATLYNIGGLFWRGTGAQYEVPKGTGRNAVFASGLWIGGIDAGGELRFAGSTYGPWEFWPGPLAADASTTPEQCAAFDRIWTLSTDDLDTYAATGTASADLAEWPVGAGAPFYTDANGNGTQGPTEPTVSLDLGDPGYGSKTLDLGAGERPVIFGRQTAWWVMNDMGGAHEWGRTEPLGIEVRATAWTTGYGIQPLARSTFYRYEIIKRAPGRLDDTRVGIFSDVDMGNRSDDHVHSDSTRGLLMFYNADEADEGPEGYGSPPPAIAIDLLSGAGTAAYFTNGGAVTSDPSDAQEAMDYMRAVWKDGTPLTAFGDGYQRGGERTGWAFPGDPVTGQFWSMENADGQGTPLTPADRKSAIAAAPVPFDQGDRIVLDVGILFGRGTDRLASVTAVRERSDLAQAAYASGELFALSGPGTPTPPPPSPTPLAPADGVVFEGAPVTFSWTAVAGTAAYHLQIDTSRTFFGATVWTTTATEIALPRTAFLNNSVARVYWRVIAIDPVGEPSLPSEVRSLRNVYFVPTPASFQVVANAAGPVDPPQPAAAAFQGFPTMPQGANPAGIQQANGTRWLVATVADGFDGTFASFLEVALPGENRERFGTTDFEVRFTGPSVAVRAADGLVVEVPFELWATGEGTPDDPADDVRMIPVLHDLDGDGAFGLSTPDSPASSGDDDPATDGVTWAFPLDTSPGEAGYAAWAADAATAPDARGGAVFERMAFVGWNLGREPPYPAERPEDGTVVRIVADEPNLEIPPDPVPPPPPLPPVYAFALDVQPNPIGTSAEVRVQLSEAGAVRLRLVDALGREVAVLATGDREAGPFAVRLDAAALAGGVYVVVLDVDGRRLARTVTVTR